MQIGTRVVACGLRLESRGICCAEQSREGEQPGVNLTTKRGCTSIQTQLLIVGQGARSTERSQEASLPESITLKSLPWADSYDVIGTGSCHAKAADAVEPSFRPSNIRSFESDRTGSWPSAEPRRLCREHDRHVGQEVQPLAKH